MDTIHEGSTAVYTAAITDPDGSTVPGSAFSAVFLTLYDETTKEIINSRHDQNVLNANNVTVDGNGLLTWHLQPEDTIMINTALKGEWHTALLVFEWTTGRHTHRFRMRVVNYLHEPASSE
jgi:hypothetical protein